MKQASLSKWLKLAILGVGICVVVVYALGIPALGQTVAKVENGAFDYCFWPWLIFLWITGIPILAALVLAWKIASHIGADRSFTLENAALLKGIACLAAGDAGFFLIGNFVLWFLNRNHPSIVLFSMLVVCLGAAISVAAAALSHLVKKAAALQEQSDWTI